MTVKRKSTWVRTGFAYARLIHIYISTLLFGLVIFFCITGITLNHRWYGPSTVTNERVILLSPTQITAWSLRKKETEPWNPNLNRIHTYFKEQLNFPNTHSIDLDNEAREIILEFKVPAGFATAIISEPEAKVYLDTEQGEVLGILNDLHKGRHSGTVWFWLIDISAALMTLFAITGMVIIFQGKKNRRSGILLAVLGALTPFVLYISFVPSISN